VSSLDQQVPGLLTKTSVEYRMGGTVTSLRTPLKRCLE
jgi:hypothetical protein